MLGSEETTGLRSDYKKLQEDYGRKKSSYSDKDNSKESILRAKAVEIKRDAQLYNKVIYNIRDIETDIAQIQLSPSPFLSEEQIDNLKKILNESPQKSLLPLDTVELECKSLLQQSNELLSKQITPSKAIQELLNNALLQEWVKQGIELHKGVENRCGFCGALLSEDTWSRLGSHFNQESEDLETSITALSASIAEEIQFINDYKTLSQDQFYLEYQSEFSEILDNWAQIKTSYVAYLKKMQSELNARRLDIFNPRGVIPDVAFNFTSIITKLNKLISQNNAYTDSLKKRQDDVRHTLRLDYVHKFITDINLNAMTEEIESLKQIADSLYEQLQEIEIKVKKLESDIIIEKHKLQSEKSAADKINEYLTHYFGHNFIHLEPRTSEEQCHFIVKREDQPAYNLSEGEASLVAFCYFIAKLEESEISNNKLIIWIDDPISSLDCNHIFFVFSMIENLITSPYSKTDEQQPETYRYHQLFISTHNLDFLKYLKALHRPQKKATRYFYIHRLESHSELRCMPSYMQEYVTEFNYLFHQIYICAYCDAPDEKHEVFYGFGNNLRKFLEAYLYYKYPDNRQFIDKIKAFFDDDAISTHITNRAMNELSHLKMIFDRSMKPLDIPEIPSLAKYVLNKIEEKDKEQYDALVNSISE